MNPPTDWLAVAGTCAVGGGGLLSSPPPQATSSTPAAPRISSRTAFEVQVFIVTSSARARQRKRQVRERGQQRTDRLHLGTRLVHAVVQAEHRGAQRHGA